MSTLYVDNLQPNLGSQVEIPDLKPLAGSVVQQVQYFTTTSFNTSSNSSFVKTNLELSITPKYATSNINIMITGTGYASALGGLRGQIWKNGSSISGFNEEDLIAYLNDTPATSDMTTTFYTDTNIGSTSPITYAYYIRSYSSSAQVYFYRNQGIILQEIAQ